MAFYSVTNEDIPLPHQVYFVVNIFCVFLFGSWHCAYKSLYSQKHHEQAKFVLSVETEELGINAGLQDRVIQSYGGCVYMDFSREIMEKQGHGDYTHLPINKVNYLNLLFQILHNQFSNNVLNKTDTTQC